MPPNANTAGTAVRTDQTPPVSPRRARRPVLDGIGGSTALDAIRRSFQRALEDQETAARMAAVLRAYLRSDR